MRRILTKKQQKRKERFNQIIIGVVLIFLMMASIIGYSLLGKDSGQENQETIVYNGIEFINRNGFWLVELENTQLTFKYNPQEVEKIDSLVNNLNSYYNEPLYVYSEDTEATSEIYANMNQFVERMQNACLEEGCGEDLPVKNCSNNFIIIRENKITGINQNQSCVFIEGPRENLVRLTDEFLFKIFGIE